MIAALLALLALGCVASPAAVVSPDAGGPRVGCATDDDCDEGRRCTRMDDPAFLPELWGASLCLEPCDGPEDCRADEECARVVPAGGGRACMVGCTCNADCAEGDVCSGTCAVDPQDGRPGWCRSP